MVQSLFGECGNELLEAHAEGMRDLAQGYQRDVVGATLDSAEKAAVNLAHLSQFLLADTQFGAPRLDGRANTFQDVSITFHMLNIILNCWFCQSDIVNNIKSHLSTLPILMKFAMVDLCAKSNYTYIAPLSCREILTSRYSVVSIPACPKS